MSIPLPPDIPEKFRKDFVLGYLHNQIAKLFCVLGREKLPKLYQIALNGDISFDTLRALDEEKGQKLAEKIIGFEEFENLFKQKCREKCEAMLFHSTDETDKLLLCVFKALKGPI